MIQTNFGLADSLFSRTYTVDARQLILGLSIPNLTPFTKHCNKPRKSHPFMSKRFTLSQIYKVANGGGAEIGQW
ncbi:MFS general substrate transporter [Moniliophthora roreri]|nr:MFS general substrate transporter [Moniliophthora roreri]